MPIVPASSSDGAHAVAVLDDDQTLSMVICRVLQCCGFRADHFADVASFDAAVGRRRYDAFVLDWQLVGVTTQDVIRRLRQATHVESPIFLYTGQPAVDGAPVEPEIATTLAIHRVQFRQKPYSLRALANEIHQSLASGSGPIRRTTAGGR